uniref:transposase n=1 Tax=Streptomyces albicerus TaxID=2569859 RepID=UPI00124B2F42|nr:transposase [Streptomyces albicerus]
MAEYTARFDDLFADLAQRRGFRDYLTGLLTPRDRNKTITCLAGAEPVVGAGGTVVQRLQFFLSESSWDADRVNDRRLQMLCTQETTAPHDGGVIVIDDSGDRKDGTITAHVGRQWLGRLGNTDSRIVTVTTVWTDGHVYFALREADLPYVVALKPHRGTWARADQPHTPIDAARALTGTDPDHPGDWTPVERHFRDGHTETWWTADARLGGYDPDSPCRLVVATTDPGTLPEKATWYLATNLPHPDAPHAATSQHPPADLAEIVRLYRLRPWIEQSYKQIKDELGWGFQSAPTGPSAATRPW